MAGSANRPSPEAVAPEAWRHEAPHPAPAQHGRSPEPGAACHAESVHVRSPSVAWRGLVAGAAAALLLAGCAADARTPSAAARARPTSTTSAPTTTTSTLPVTPIA